MAAWLCGVSQALSASETSSSNGVRTSSPSSALLRGSSSSASLQRVRRNAVARASRLPIVAGPTRDVASRSSPRAARSKSTSKAEHLATRLSRSVTSASPMLAAASANEAAPTPPSPSPSTVELMFAEQIACTKPEPSFCPWPASQAAKANSAAASASRRERLRAFKASSTFAAAALQELLTWQVAACAKKSA
eukprot:CAMPEP_0169275016 /NCGR_PEP_ID=MMETSP1016-20121227/52070_1 /TAXON_ID=342587 /ORGANISM="Karlodinium micrum, Strain CCMP2283" /LENGTH=192 /DNA_ID=CAMNT_0009361689 /DNA_START=235 /DNA_END=812 /DNA_ORIENTATION=+